MRVYLRKKIYFYPDDRGIFPVKEIWLARLKLGSGLLVIELLASVVHQKERSQWAELP
jgi:hypothetical protein